MGCQASTFRFSRRPAPRTPSVHHGQQQRVAHPPSPRTPSVQPRQQQRVALPPSPRTPSVQPLPLSPRKVYELENRNSKTDANLPRQLVPIVDYNSPAVYDVSPDKLVGNKVTDRLKRAGLESTKLIFAFDFTKSNEQRGAKSFNGKSLHYIGAEQNPYEQAVSIIGKTLDYFDKDGMIPCFGFGDASTTDQEVFSFYPDECACCNGFEEVTKRYREIVPQLQLGGPKSFAPVIEMAMTIVEQSGGQYHVLVILADGEVTGGNDTALSQLSPLERKTVDAIVKAREYPLSIVVVGVGDGPWDMVMKFDREIPGQAFDNFQFVNAADILSENMKSSRKEVKFASEALRQLPYQYKAIQELGILGATRENAVSRIPLPLPCYSSGFVGSDRAPHVSDNHLCPVCLSAQKDMAFRCGHQTCRECGYFLEKCPICRSAIDLKIELFVGIDSAPHVSDNHLCPICLTAQKNMALCCGHQVTQLCIAYTLQN
ncbi:E3 ubiquitin-protein ligase RGLG1-like [Rosa sericea]